MLPPKTSNHAKFHRDRSNQVGDMGWSEKNFHTQTDTWHPDWLSRASQHARGATKNKWDPILLCSRSTVGAIWQRCDYYACPSVCLKPITQKRCILQLWLLCITNGKLDAESRTHWPAWPSGHWKWPKRKCRFRSIRQVVAPSICSRRTSISGRGADRCLVVFDLPRVSQQLLVMWCD